MAENDRSTARSKARQAAGVTDEVATVLSKVDSLVAYESANVQALIKAIAKLAVIPHDPHPHLHRDMIKSLAHQAEYWSMNIANEVNGALERIGCDS